MTPPSLATRVLDFAILPSFLVAAVTATHALLGHPAVPLLAIPGLVVGGAAVAAAILERVRPEREDNRPLDQPLYIEAAHYLFNYNLGYGLALAACVPVARAAAALFPAAPWPTAWPLAPQILLAAVLAEGASYWQHRLSHRNAWLWKFHALHHSGGRLNIARTARFHFVDIGPGSFLVFAPLVLLRAPDAIVTWAAVLSGTFGVLQHANIRLRTPSWLDRVVCTPAVHRFHHARDGRDSNANFGTLVMVFDRLFGSYRLPPAPVPAAIGIDGDTVPRGSFWRQLLEPFRAARAGQPSPPR